MRFPFFIPILYVFFFTLTSSVNSEDFSEDLRAIYSYDVDDETVSFDLADHIQEFIDSQGMLSLQEVISKNEFHTVEKGRVRNYKESDSYWYRFGIKNTSDKSLDFILKTKNRNIIDSGFYHLAAEQLFSYQNNEVPIVSVVVDSKALGDFFSLKNRQIRSRNDSLIFVNP